MSFSSEDEAVINILF